MRVLKKSSENEMIALFLKEEINSVRYNKKIVKLLEKMNIDEAVVVNCDLTNDEENKSRRKLLAQYRGYGLNKDIFKNFPVHIDWYLVDLSVEDILRIKYITYDYWIELSNGSRLAKDSVNTIKSNTEIFDVSNSGFIKAAEYISNGNKFAPIILVAPVENKGNMIVLEGHLRLTAMNLAIDKIDSITALIGYAKESELNKWDTY
jgi:hypothetical protein